jgi:hypothetical protein
MLFVAFALIGLAIAAPNAPPDSDTLSPDTMVQVLPADLEFEVAHAATTLAVVNLQRVCVVVEHVERELTLVDNLVAIGQAEHIRDSTLYCREAPQPVPRETRFVSRVPDGESQPPRSTEVMLS